MEGAESNHVHFPIDVHHLLETVRKIGPKPKQMDIAVENGISFSDLDKVLYDDLHAALSRLDGGEDESTVWSNLGEIFHDNSKALEYLGPQVSPEELRHARGASRCLAACVTQICLKHDYDSNKDDSFLDAIIAEDQDFRIIYALWRWCIDRANESSGFSDLARELQDIKMFSGSARSDMRRLRSTKQISADPDSILSAADPNFDKFMRVMFSLLRCGRFEEAMELSGELYTPWMTLPICTQRLLIDQSLLPAQLTEREQASLRYRELSFQIMANVVTEIKYTMSVRMVFAALVGDWKFLLPLANNFEDRLWCYVNAAVQAKLNMSLGLIHPIYTPRSADGIFEAIITADTSPYHVIMSFMVREAWSDAIKWMNDYSEVVQSESSAPACSLYRFFGVITAACHILRHSHEEDHRMTLIGHMVDVLREKRLFSQIPFYAALLQEQEAMKRIWNVMSYVKTDSDRYTFIEALKKAGLDGEGIAVEFGRFHVLEEVDHTDRLHWIYACSDEQLVYAVSEANSVIRYYLLSDMEAEASTVVNECEKLKIIERLATQVRNMAYAEQSQMESAAEVVIDEFNSHRLYLSAVANCRTFAVECAKSANSARQITDDERAGNHLRQGDLLDLSHHVAQMDRNKLRYEHSKIVMDACKEKTLDAVMVFLHHPGWRLETAKDWGRTEQLKALRQRFYANILNLLLRTLDMYGDASIILKLLPVLADEDLKINEDLAKDDLSHFLLGVHAIAGHLLG